MSRVDPPHRVVVIGGGFGGLNAARALARLPVAVTLVDRANYHLFQPLLYQVATGGLSPADIASPLRHVLARHANVRTLLGEVLASTSPRAVCDSRTAGSPTTTSSSRPAPSLRTSVTTTGRGGSRAEDAGGRDAHPRARPRSVRAGGARARTRGARDAAHLRDRRRRTDRRRAGGRARRDRAGHARARLPLDRPALGAHRARRGAESGYSRLPRSALAPRARVARGARRRGLAGPTVTAFAPGSRRAPRRRAARASAARHRPVGGGRARFAARGRARARGGRRARPAGARAGRAGPVAPEASRGARARRPRAPRRTRRSSAARARSRRDAAGRARARAILRARLAARPAPAFRYVDKGNLATIGRRRAVAQIRALAAHGVRGLAAVALRAPLLSRRPPEPGCSSAPAGR